ncbi:MBL fold metallo-hydrolase [Antarcticirhabdus aurantiaca]|uniref:MBL fold metallo-hydrolase n=1 Tax=Antarcticirhabdus aurantiaca TaxID=2606717 RepID=A0ACD4NVU2_9HYPH|nr:MBL fold metallo-hydrolase [Antarcticirhabdus aurantiaca]WAJ30917.1 MBL fold metallo-hydrolase [Jeongeuplla avenae]
MSDRLRLTILGCASSPGVPRIGGDWGACDPTNPKNRRRRSSALVERIGPRGTTRVNIDCGPDFREQMLSADVPMLDAVVLTHQHADHIHGLDDLRGFALIKRGLVPVYCNDDTYERVLEGFRYCFQTPPGSDYPPIVERRRIVAGETFSIDGDGGRIDILPFEQQHGSIVSLGFRIGALAYCSDVSDFPPGAQQAIRGARHIVVDALQYRPHPSHLSLDQAVDWIARLGVPEATLTHMHTPLDYETVSRLLPDHIRPAFDGLTIEFDLD